MANNDRGRDDLERNRHRRNLRNRPELATGAFAASEFFHERDRPRRL